MRSERKRFKVSTVSTYAWFDNLSDARVHAAFLRSLSLEPTIREFGDFGARRSVIVSQ